MYLFRPKHRMNYNIQRRSFTHREKDLSLCDQLSSYELAALGLQVSDFKSGSPREKKSPRKGICFLYSGGLGLPAVRCQLPGSYGFTVLNRAARAAGFVRAASNWGSDLFDHVVMGLLPSAIYSFGV